MDPRSTASARLRDAAVLLPFAGLLLLMPPFVGLFPAAATLFGIPVLVLYVFGVWAVLIVLAAWFARRLPDPAAPRAAAPTDQPPPAAPPTPPVP